MARKTPCVYILASKPHGTLYIGVTSDPIQRIWQHKTDQASGFTSRYGVHRLVYFELHDEMKGAILREKQMKKWNRAWKIRQIEEQNPDWCELYEVLLK